MTEVATPSKPVASRLEPKKEAVKSPVEIASAAIASYRSEQVKSVDYRLSGSEILAFVGGALVAKAFVAIEVEKEKGETHTAYLHRKTERNKGLLAEALQAYAAFAASNIFSSREADGYLIVVSTDGRKYKVNLKTGLVEA